MIKLEGRGFKSHPGKSFPLSLCGPISICRANAHMVYGLKHQHFTSHSITTIHLCLQTFPCFVCRSMQVDITGVSALEDLQFLGDTSYRILDDSVMVSRSSSVSSRSSVEESADELSFTLNE